MNNAKIASLLRQLAEAYEEDAAETVPPPAKSAPRSRRPRTVVAPEGTADDLTKARAERALRTHGFRSTGS